MRYAKHNDVVLDTFGGSGSTLIACEQTGRVCRTMVLDPKYCDVIRRRWAEFVHGEGCDWQTLTPTADTGEEKDRIKKAQEAYSMAEGLVDKYAAKLRSAQDETRRQAGSVKPQGSFYARAASALRGNMMEQRMFQATQEIEKHTKKTAELLKNMDGGGSLTFQ